MAYVCLCMCLEMENDTVFPPKFESQVRLWFYFSTLFCFFSIVLCVHIRHTIVKPLSQLCIQRVLLINLNLCVCFFLSQIDVLFCIFHCCYMLNVHSFITTHHTNYYVSFELHSHNMPSHIHRAQSTGLSRMRAVCHSHSLEDEGRKKVCEKWKKRKDKVNSTCRIFFASPSRNMLCFSFLHKYVSSRSNARRNNFDSVWIYVLWQWWCCWLTVGECILHNRRYVCQLGWPDLRALWIRTRISHTHTHTPFT